MSTNAPVTRVRVRRISPLGPAQAADRSSSHAAYAPQRDTAPLPSPGGTSSRDAVAAAPVQAGPSLRIELVSPDLLVPANRYLRRPGKRQLECLQRNIRRFGIVRPILVRRENNGVIAGHSILAAAKALGLTEVPVTYIDGLSENELRALRISLHKIEAMASWDDDALRVELEYLVEVDPDLLVFTAFDTPEIDVRLGEPAAKADAADAVPAVAGPAVSRRGDVWLFKGGHRLVCGDALDPAVVGALMGQGRARLVLSDPPFNVPVAGHVSGRAGVREFAMASGEMTPAAFQDFLTTAFANTTRVSVDGSLALYFCDWRHMGEMLAAGHAVYAELKNLIIWAKTNAGMGSLWRSQHELVFAWKLGSAPHANNVELGKHGRWRSNVWSYPGANTFGRTRDEELAGHVTPKGVAMLYDAILDVTNRGDAVLDPFAGAGSTLVAAHRARRVGYGVEIDPLYVHTAVRHLEAFTKAPALHAETARPSTRCDASGAPLRRRRREELPCRANARPAPLRPMTSGSATDDPRRVTGSGRARCATPGDGPASPSRTSTSSTSRWRSRSTANRGR